LARKHHPDKLKNISDEEKINHEAIFKEISNAYSDIEKDIKNGGSGNSTYASYSNDDWRSIWNELEAMFQSPGAWEKMASIVKNTVHDVTVEGLKQLKTHHIKINITLEEAHMKKQKKLRLFLSDIQEPIFVTVDTGEYPIMDIKHVLSNGFPVNITITMELLPHPIYRLDDVLDSWDLFTVIKTTWVDYINGKELTLKFVDGKTINVTLEPFNAYKGPICIENHGLCGLGHLYISVDMATPSDSKGIWKSLPQDKKELFINMLQELYV
jgi:DnaJ-class molecular chaperone